MKSIISLKIHSFFLIIYFTFTGLLFPQDSLSLPAVQYGSMLTDGNKLYMFGGIADNNISNNIFFKPREIKSILLNDLGIGDPEQNKWAKEDPANEVKPEERRYHKAIWDKNSNSIFVYGGTSGGPILNDLWKYDIKNKTWTKISQQGTIPSDRLLPAMAPVKDGFLLVGGKNSQGLYTGDCWFYNIENNLWTQQTNPPAGIEFGSQSFKMSDSVIALWGGANNPYLNEIWLFNKESNNWFMHSISGTGPQNKLSDFIMEKIGDKVYLGGGVENFTIKVDDFYSIDLITWQWTKLADLPVKLFSASSSVINEKLYVYGGSDENSIRSNKIYMYDPSANQWTEKNPIRVYPCLPPTDLTAQLVNGKPNLSWNDNSSVEDGYRIERKSVTESWDSIYSTGPNTTQHFDSNVELGKHYYYRVCAYNFTGYSSYSNETDITITDIEVNDLSPDQFHIYQNYPNPFNSSTIIKLSIPAAGFVQIKIFNILGQEIRTLVQDFRNAGVYEVEFNSGNLQSGVYYCCVTFKENLKALQLILMK